MGRLAIGLAVVGLVIAAAPAGAEPPAPSATGRFQGVLSSGSQDIAFKAHEVGSGRVVGQLRETLVFGSEVSELRGKVTCLAISGHRAAIGYLVLESSGILALSMPVGTQQMFLVQDSAAGDTFAFGGHVDCPAAIAIEPIFPIARGDITVRG
jgi:hypothetical protein